MTLSRRTRALSRLRSLEQAKRWQALAALRSARASYGEACERRATYEQAFATATELAQRQWYLTQAISVGEELSRRVAELARAQRTVRAHELRDRGLRELWSRARRDERRWRERLELGRVLDAYATRLLRSRP